MYPIGEVQANSATVHYPARCFLAQHNILYCRHVIERTRQYHRPTPSSLFPLQIFLEEGNVSAVQP